MIKTVFIFWALILSTAFSAEKYVVNCRGDLLDKSREVMLRQAGTLEKGKNRGKEIDIYCKSVGLPLGSSYCAAGQYYCFYTACAELGISTANIPFKPVGLANSIYDYFKKYGSPDKYTATMDDFLVWRHPSSSFGHIERIVSTGKAGWVTTIGFNSTRYIDGIRTEGVFYQKRNILHPLNRMKIRGLAGFRRI